MSVKTITYYTNPNHNIYAVSLTYLENNRIKQKTNIFLMVSAEAAMDEMILECLSEDADIEWEHIQCIDVENPENVYSRQAPHK